MAELNTADSTTDACCAPAQQATCCEPSAKDGCCGHDAGCGCDAGSTTKPAHVREQVRERYAAAAKQGPSTEPDAGCCAPSETFDGGKDASCGAPRQVQQPEGDPDRSLYSTRGHVVWSQRRDPRG
jgi:hypothetical protein